MTNSVNGKWISTKDGSSAFLQFEEDGTLTGSDGGNRISTTWGAEEPGAVVKPFATTQRAVMGMEAWVGRVHRVEAEGDVLTVFDHSGNHLGVLNRAAASDESDEGR
ncbi:MULTISPECIES: META domain-containing protein [Brevibacterium]|uniref:META domain-containing protein n=1 Tax=Brevibacterium TaxID=1696 RepID=UPI0018E03B11|nr:MULTISPECIES: META domain-containing protein [Brevibacterium]MCF2588456.1 META domain-containing protein [Brevibacterium sp. UCMA 11752]